VEDIDIYVNKYITGFCLIKDKVVEKKEEAPKKLN